ncbi:MAG: family 3 adenylate cyclase, partial [Lacunisphaera sp.]|nr:family 3 adenylate cyclase [Lacunisphaera sp.]
AGHFRGHVDARLESPELGTFLLTRPLSIGRSANCDIVIHGNEASRRHALINPQAGGEVWLVDLGSTNGTYRNDRRVTQPARLADGDRVILGGVTFTFHAGDTAGPRAPDTEVTEMTKAAIKIEQAWLVLADIEGYTRFSQAHPPEEVSRISGQWMLTCSTLFSKNNSDIQIYTGDGFLAYVIDRGDGPRNFFNILAGLREFQARERTLPFRLLVHHDYVTLGGSSPAGGESVLGPGVILLFRMEKIAKAHKSRVSLTAAAVRKWPEKISPVSLGQHKLGGFETEQELFSLELAKS